MDKPETTTERRRAEDVQRGRDEMRELVIRLIRPCLDRQPDLQKIIRAVEELY